MTDIERLAATLLRAAETERLLTLVAEAAVLMTVTGDNHLRIMSSEPDRIFDCLRAWMNARREA